MKKSFLLIFILYLLVSCTTTITEEVSVPNFKETPISGITFLHNRIFLDYIDEKGDTIRFFTDTGGGKVIYPKAAEGLDLKIDSIVNGDQIIELIDLSTAFKKANLPIPLGANFVFRGDSPLKAGNVGMLGAHWFGNKIWNFNYHEKTLNIVDSINWSDFPKNELTTIGFLQDSLGNNLTHFPSIPIIVDGDTIQTLFDTGATALLSEEAQEKFGAKTVGTSFIIASIFDKWQAQHPDWEIIKKGDQMLEEDLIKVPQVTIGGHQVGPVWFAKRKDENFTQFMSQWMDQTVEGAVGGSCLQYFSTILIDYNSGKAFFNNRPASL